MATYKYSSNDVQRNRPTQEALTANKAISVSDAGKDQNSSGGSHTHTLPELNANYVGLTYRFRNTGTAGTHGVTVSPHADNKIVGAFTLAASVVTAASSGAGALDKDIINTAGTSIYGDWVELTAISSTEWAICGSQGIWAFES
jgi:hypothetical protein|tara:strand:+ start:101 stop:532 length:432 start_codon:yes stop_codon:yes gene_type:complete